MKTEKKPVRSGVLNLEKNIQLTLDEDMIVPDTCPDVDKIVESRGHIHIDEIEVMDNKVRIKCSLLVELLYMSAGKDQRISSMEHEFSLDEYINAERVQRDDTAKITGYRGSDCVNH